MFTTVIFWQPVLLSFPYRLFFGGVGWVYHFSPLYRLPRPWLALRANGKYTR